MDKNLNIINPEDKDYYDGKLYMVGLYPGAGAELKTFYVYAGYEEEALELVVAYLDLSSDIEGLLMDAQTVEDIVYDDYGEEYNSWITDHPELDWFEFAHEYLGYVYIDATMKGASQPYFVEGNYLRIEEVNEDKEVKTEDVREYLRQRYKTPTTNYIAKCTLTDGDKKFENEYLLLDTKDSNGMSGVDIILENSRFNVLWYNCDYGVEDLEIVTEVKTLDELIDFMKSVGVDLSGMVKDGEIEVGMSDRINQNLYRYVVDDEESDPKFFEESKEVKTEAVSNEEVDKAFEEIVYNDGVIYGQLVTGEYASICRTDDYERPEDYDEGYLPKYGGSQEELDAAIEAYEDGDVYIIDVVDKDDIDNIDYIYAYIYGDKDLKYYLKNEFTRFLKVKKSLPEHKEIKIESITTDINRAKQKLINKAKKKGGIWENFGQDEVRALEDKYFDERYNNNGVWSAIRNFDDWCMNFTLSDLNENKESKTESVEPEENKKLDLKDRVKYAYENCNYSKRKDMPTVSDIMDYLGLDTYNNKLYNQISDILYELGYDWQLESKQIQSDKEIKTEDFKPATVEENPEIKDPHFWWEDKDTFIMEFEGGVDNEGDKYWYLVEYWADEDTYHFFKQYDYDTIILNLPEDKKEQIINMMKAKMN